MMWSKRKIPYSCAASEAAEMMDICFHAEVKYISPAVVPL